MAGTTGTFSGFKIAAVFQRNKGVRPLCHRSFVLKRLCEQRDARWDCSWNPICCSVSGSKAMQT